MNPNGNSPAPACGVCGTPFPQMEMPESYAANFPAISTIAAPHEQPYQCAKCGTYYALMIAQWQLVWSWSPCDPPKETKRIVEATSLILH